MVSRQWTSTKFGNTNPFFFIRHDELQKKFQNPFTTYFWQPQMDNAYKLFLWKAEIHTKQIRANNRTRSSSQLWIMQKYKNHLKNKSYFPDFCNPHEARLVNRSCNVRPIANFLRLYHYFSLQSQKATFIDLLKRARAYSILN